MKSWIIEAPNIAMNIRTLMSTVLFFREFKALYATGRPPRIVIAK